MRKAGFAPLLKDSEIITMLLIGELLGMADNTKIWLYFISNQSDFFPRIKLVKDKIFNKQATDLCNIIQLLHKQLLSIIGQWQLLLADEVPLPICQLARSKLQNYLQLKLLSIFVQQKEHYYGFKLLLLTTYTGIPLDYNLAAANIDERKLLLDTNISANTTIIADKGFIGKDVINSLKLESNVT